VENGGDVTTAILAGKAVQLDDHVGPKKEILKNDHVISLVLRFPTCQCRGLGQHPAGARRWLLESNNRSRIDVTLRVLE